MGLNPLMFTCRTELYLKYYYISGFNGYMFEIMCGCNLFLILDDCYQLVSHRVHFGHNNMNYNGISWNKNISDPLKYFVHRQIGGNDYIQYMFIS